MNTDKFVYTVDTPKILNDNSISIGINNKNIIQKTNRPYYVAIPLDSDYSAFVPIRTNLPHKFGFITKGTGRNTSGLDYTKSLIVETKKIQQYLISETGVSFAEWGHWNISTENSGRTEPKKEETLLNQRFCFL